MHLRQQRCWPSVRVYLESVKMPGLHLTAFRDDLTKADQPMEALLAVDARKAISSHLLRRLLHATH
jgi:hypothetical protein